MSSPVDRFWASIDKPDGDAGCWIWRLGSATERYPKIKAGDRRPTVHRFAYETFVGPIPDGMYVCHRCDNTKCVNPSHLFLGTPLENMGDKIAKGRLRVPLGTEHGMAKLTDAQVVELRRAYAAGEANQYQLAERFGITQGSVSMIVRRKLWSHI